MAELEERDAKRKVTFRTPGLAHGLTCRWSVTVEAGSLFRRNTWRLSQVV